MPFKRVGRTIYVKKRGKWKKKLRARTVPRAIRALSKLRSLGY